MKLVASVTIISLLVSAFAATPAYSDDRRNYDHRREHQSQYYENQNQEHRKKKNNNDWLVPLVGGIILGGIIVGANKPNEQRQTPYTPPTPPIYGPQQMVCHNEWARDYYGNYALDNYGRPYQVQYCKFQ